ncbi:hypothetical protein AB0H43_20745 [Hamadaea sp. NPDC050747]|uniref:hypothetical protein n=1 Tax=Hamadaea sp. NPDC050747 TaxID=3155789 RepID=UPI0033F1685D
MTKYAGYVAATAATVYIGLKALWIAGWPVGVADFGSVTSAQWRTDNVVTGAIGVVGLLAGLAAVRPWGRRLPAWMVGVPMWVGVGLLAPFVVVIPLAGIFWAAGWWEPSATQSASTDPTLRPWVYGVVYGSFIVLGIALAVAWTREAYRRFGPVLRGPITSPRGATFGVQVPLAWGAACLAAGLALVRLAWLLDLGPGLLPGGRSAFLRLQDAVSAAQFLLAAGGVLVAVHRRGARPFVVPLAAAWLGAGGMLGASVLDLPGIMAGDRWAPAGQSFSGYATSVVVALVAGGVISLVMAFLLAERAAVATIGSRVH